MSFTKPQILSGVYFTGYLVISTILHCGNNNLHDPSEIQRILLFSTLWPISIPFALFLGTPQLLAYGLENILKKF